MEATVQMQADRISELEALVSKMASDAKENELQLRDRFILAEENALKAAEGAQIAAESAEAAGRSAMKAEAGRKSAEAKLADAKAHILRLTDEKAKAYCEAEAVRSKAEKAASEVREIEQLKKTQQADLQERIREKEEKRKVAVAEKESLQRELKNSREQLKHFKRKCDEDEAEKKRLQQQVTNAKAEVDRLKKDAKSATQAPVEQPTMKPSGKENVRSTSKERKLGKSASKAQIPNSSKEGRQEEEPHQSTTWAQIRNSSKERRQEEGPPGPVMVTTPRGGSTVGILGAIFGTR